MRKLSKTSKTLLSGSILLLFTFNLYNLLNFVFHFSMARLLSIADYGVLATLFSINYILGIFTESIQTVITKYSTSLKDGMLKNLLKRSLRKSVKISFVIFLLYLIIIIPLSYLLKISYPLMLLSGLLIFCAFLPPVVRGILQGKKMFKFLGLN